MTSKLTMTALAAICGVIGGSPAYAATNILPTAYTSVTVDGTDGVLSAADAGWSGGSTASDKLAPITGAVQPEATQWNHGSFWWDASVSTVSWTVTLDKSYALTGFSIQADDNDTYLLQYWNGSTWADAVDVGTYGAYGLVTRPTYSLATPITTHELRFTATGGDGLYALGHIEAYGSVVPEPSTWVMMLAGFAGLGFAGFRAARKSVAAA